MAHLSKEFNITLNGKVALSLDKGELDVRGWDEECCKLVVESEKPIKLNHKAKSDKLYISLAGELTKQVQVYLPKMCDLFVDGSYLDLSIANLDYKVKVDNGNGKTSITNIDGEIKVEQSKGSIEFVSNHGKVRADLGAVETEVYNHQGEINLDIGRGNLNLKGLDGDARLILAKGKHVVTDSRGTLNFNSSGDISITSSRFTRVKGRGFGDTVLHLPIAYVANYSLTTSGDFYLGIPSDSAFSLKAKVKSIDNKVDSLQLTKGNGEYKGDKGLHPLGDVSLEGKHLKIESIVLKDDSADFYDKEENQESLKILRMVEEGTLDPQKAEELLETFEEFEKGEN
ncbi:hypothetical protein PRVXH_000543 [Proteinivorax hydrogeniformans]|uniref:YvlB/LiaX N-terminal domain-containing protein n=1 Tax=Proteinivorax hydrogeniformans TaxID=1826727 RepID=A0AAU8HV37_9FIRM